MTICRTSDNAFECFEANVLSHGHKRIRRQDRFDIMEEGDGFEESNTSQGNWQVVITNKHQESLDSSPRKDDGKKGDVSPSRPNPITSRWSLPEQRCMEAHKQELVGIRKRLSVEDLTNRHHNRSSLILDWLADPENKIMFQGRNIDSRIFRSHSAVERRSVCNFVKNNRFHSMRHQAKEETSCPGNTNMLNEEFCTPNCDVCRETHKAGKEITTGVVEGPVVTKEDRITSSQVPNLKRESDAKESSSAKPDASMDIAMEFRKLDLSIPRGEHAPVSGCISLPGCGELSKSRMVRRMNSDAFFYKDIVRGFDGRSCERRMNSCCSRKRRNRLSLRLRELVENSLPDISINSMEINDSPLVLDVNSREFVSKIEKIFAYGDLQQINELAECGFDFNAKDSEGNCALHYAALRGSEKIITKILEHGGNVWTRNNRNQLPVELASNINVRMLLSGVTLFYRGQYSKEIESRLTSKGMNFEL